ncbi:glycosyltransferase [Herbaspirillum sp. LeCh32-8]|uniref:glycosyltransferase n=1 Tax=Herbaspirillum sp. LeCh32-8 TaxID=2821356 RepID=UPI001AE18F85|nr:glycosyltransferase [Herbaspirillum sp. LeCh32-8]MBP0600730.1 glycosyltransferase [Herbaspirillum sp. LeCh32-8]
MQRSRLHSPPGHPYYIYAPPYRETSSGVRVLHLLCHALNLAGREAYIASTDSVNPQLKTPPLTRAIIDRHLSSGQVPIAVYPEVIAGNPLGTEVCARYILNRVGALTGRGLDAGEDDLLFYFSTQWLDNPEQKASADILFLPDIDPTLSTPEDAHERTKTYLYQHRFPLEKIDFSLFPPDTELLSMANPVTLTQLIEKLKIGKVLYTYELSSTCTQAMLCGCPVIYREEGGLTETPLPALFGTDGAAMISEPDGLERARATVARVHDRWLRVEETFWAALEVFTDKTQARAKHKQAAKRQANQAVTVKKKKRIAVVSAEPADGPCPHLRFTRPFTLAADWELLWAIKDNNIDLEMLKSADLVVFQRYTPGLLSTDKLASILALCKKTVYDTDDLLHEIPDYHPQAASARGWKEGIEYMARRADAVVVSTPFLKEKLSLLNRNVHVMPNYLDYDMFYRPVAVQGERPVHIGMLGTSLQGPNFALVDAALRKIVATHPGKVKLSFVGWTPPAGWENHPAAEFHPVINSYLDYADTLKKMEWDIGLIPLADDEFNHSKTATKWLEYSAAGIAGIFSDVSVYNKAVTQGETGLLVPADSDAWFQAIDSLITYPERRIRLAEQAQTQVRERFSIAANLGAYIGLYDAIVENRAQALPRTAPQITAERSATPAPRTKGRPVIRPMTPALRTPAGPRAAAPAASQPGAQPVPVTPSVPAAATAGRARPRVAVYSVESTWSPCPQIRLILPFEYMKADWELVWAIKDGKVDLDAATNADIVVLHRFTPGLFSQADLEHFFRLGKTVIYETDDLLNDIPDYHPQAADSRKWKPGIEYVVKHAHGVTVSTPFLADKYRSLNSNIHVLPNYLDFDRFYRPPAATSGEVITIGLLGTSITGPNFALVDEALRTLCERHPGKIKVHLVGWECPKGWTDHPAAVYEPFIHQYQDYARKLHEWNWDIALVPLVNDDFNHSKSAIKWLEYAAAGIAPAFSDVSVYNGIVEHGRTGLLVQPSYEAWLEALESLVTQAAMRRSLARTAQAEVRKHYSLHKKVWEYDRTYRGFSKLPVKHHEEEQRLPALLLLDRSGSQDKLDSLMKTVDEGQYKSLTRIILTTMPGQLPEWTDQLRYVQFGEEEFGAALEQLAAHDDFDWMQILETD